VNSLLHETQAPAPVEVSEPPLSVEERIEDFLDHLCAPLVGIVPYRERHALREEVRLHLECLIAEYQEKSASEAAIEAAFREFGEPWQSGEEFLGEWRPKPSPKGARRLVRSATMHAFAWFGLPTVLCLLLTERTILYPQQEWLLPYLFVLAFASPLIAGMLTGWSVPQKAGLGIGRAVSLLALLSLAVGMTLLPKLEGLLFGVFQFGYWLPIGWVTATSTATTLQQYRRHRFLRFARR
jgi:hypothetical protein